MTGTLLTLLGASAPATLVAALGVGAAAAAAVHQVMGYLRRSESGALAGPSALAGARARVIVGLDAARPGKVAVPAEDRTDQLVARLHERAGVDHFEVGDAVVVVRVQDGVALVAEPTFLQ